jgi:hypothetical protein
MPSGGGLTGGWQTEHYSSPAHTMSRLGASGRRGGPIWAVVRDREVPKWWLDNGNDFGGSSGGGSSRERGEWMRSSVARDGVNLGGGALL